jgi:hypothetical protein
MTNGNPPRRTLTMTVTPLMPGAWIPATRSDRELQCDLLRSLSHRAIFLAGSDGDVQFLRACAAHNVVVILDPDRSRFEPPSPTPESGQGARKKKLPKATKSPRR